MNLLPLVSIALAACQAPVAAAPVATPTAQQGETQVRVYDLTPLALRTSEAQIVDQAWPALSEWTDEDPLEWESNLDDEAPATLLRALFARDFEYEGNGIEYLSDGRFVVQGPAALHERIARALPQMDAVLNATVELELDLVHLEQAPPAGASLVPEAQVSALIVSAEKDGRLVRRRFSVSSSRPETSVQGRWVDVLADYNCEVAQGSYCFDPVSLRVHLGTRLALRAAPGQGGVFVAMTMRRTSGVGSGSERRLERTARISNERDMRVDEVSLLHQRLPVLDRALALNSFLPDGQALVVASSQGTVGAHELLIVRRVGGGLARTARLASGSGGPGLLLVDASGWAPPYAGSSMDDFELVRAPLDPLRNGASLWITLNGPRERGVDVEHLLYGFPTVTGVELGNLEPLMPWLALSPEEGGALPDVEKTLGSFAPDQRLVQMSLVLRAPGSEAPIASLSLPLRTGVESVAVLGVEDTYVGEADVEIAQDASVEDPILCSVFDGLKLELSPRFALDGSLVLGLKGQASARDGELRKLDAGAGAVGEIETTAQRYLLLSEDLRFPAGGGAPRIVVGDLTGGLSLEVEARF